jgi:hypothetical protein
MNLSPGIEMDRLRCTELRVWDFRTWRSVHGVKKLFWEINWQNYPVTVFCEKHRFVATEFISSLYIAFITSNLQIFRSLCSQQCSTYQHSDTHKSLRKSWVCNS